MASNEVEEGYKKALEKLKEVEDKYKGKPLTAQGFQELKKAQNQVSLYTKTGAFSRGLARVASDVVTGLPDLAAMGINYGIRKASGSEQPVQLPILGEQVRKVMGVPEQELDPANQFLADAPGYVAAAVGVGQLAKGLWKGYRAISNNSKFKKLLGEMPKDQANAFKQYMVNGQGSDSPLVQSAIERMRSTTEYKELFNTLEEGAAKAGAKVASVRPSSQTAEEAVTGATKSVEDAVQAVKKARDNAGAANFDAAVKAGGNRPIISTDGTMKALANIRKRFSTDTPEGQSALRYINQLEESFSARIATPDGDLILKSIKPKLTVSQIQNKMREFGAQIGGNDAAVNSLSVNTKDLINKAVFGGLKGDLATAGSKVKTTADKQAIGYLIKARDQYSKGTAAYNDLVAKGIPKFLRDKPVNEIELPALIDAYEGLSGSQRKLFRNWVGENRAESLQAIDKAVFDQFKNKAFRKGTDGKQTYDLGELAREWEKIRKTDPEKASMISDALGVKASEFSARMKDALVFTRRMDTGVEKVAGDAVKNKQQLSALAGASPLGYQAAKVTDLTIEAVNSLMKKNGISDEMLMKMLLTDEGAQFLKSASLSPQGRETLEKLTKLDTAGLPKAGAYLLGGGVPQGMVEGATSEEIVVPDEIPQDFMQQFQQEAAQPTDEIVVPDELPQDFINQYQQAPEQPTSDPMGEFIQGLPQQTSEAPMAPQQYAGVNNTEDPVRQHLMKMKQVDPYLNVDYMMKAYEQAPEEQKKKLLGMFG